MIFRSFLTSLIILSLVGTLALPKLLHKENNLSVLGINQNPKNQTDIPQESYPKAIKTPNFQEAPEISAESAIIIDAKSGQLLYEKNPNIKHLPASTTKMMTALVALEKCSPQTAINIKRVEKTGTQMGLTEGDTVTAENLLYGLLINSGNDAALALAENCSDSYNGFIISMNEKAKELGMKNTHFINPAGFDDRFQYSTAKDLAILAKVAISNPLIAKIVATKSTVVTDYSGIKTYYLENVNKLLGIVNGVEGVKTGQTEGALEILITKTTRNGDSIITSVLGSHDRFDESKKLIEWAFTNYRWEN